MSRSDDSSADDPPADPRARHVATSGERLTTSGSGDSPGDSDSNIASRVKARALASLAGSDSASSDVGDSHDDDPEQRVGTMIEKYRIIRLLGRGGMGSVYAGEDTALKRPVAIKILPKTRLGKPAVFERFMREAQVAGSLDHPNIISIYDVVQDERGCYIVMEVLHPMSAGSRLKSGPYNWLVATRIIADCCAALKSAHKAGIVHRDIKPDNILFSPSGIVKLIDFGLVKLMEEDLHLTRSGAVCGTPLYMSPEQAQKKGIDPRSDLYSLGGTYYSLLTGWPPYLGLSVVQILLQHVQSPTPNPRELISDIPERCVRVVMRAMKKQRQDRYQSAAEMGADLEAILRQHPAARTGSIFAIDKNAPATPARQTAFADDSLEFSSGQRETNPLVTRPALLRMSVVELAQPLPEVPRSSRRGFLIAGGTAALTLGGGALLMYDHGRRTRAARDKAGTQPVKTPLSAPPLKVGILHSLSGALAVSERPLADASLLAIAEINEAGGLLGRRVQPIMVDGQSQVTANSAFAQAAEQLLAKEDVAAVFGGFGSAGRKAIRPYFEKYDRLLFYPGQYEGLEESTSIVYTGATPNQFALPAVQYFCEQLGAKRFFFIGTDGLRAHATNAIVSDYIKQLGGEVVGEHYDPVGECEFASLIKQIEKTKPQVVINMYVGDSSIAFFRALANAPPPQPAIPVLSFLFGENELLQLGQQNLAGHYVARTRFPASAVEPKTTLAQRFAARYGAHRPMSEEIEAAYYGVHLWAAAVKQAGSAEVNHVRLALKQKEYDVLGARLHVDPSNQHIWKLFVLAKIGAENRIEIVKTVDAAIPPVPFPGPRTRMEWQVFADALYERWGDNWANPQKPQPKKNK